MLTYINMFVKITCDRCGASQIGLEPEGNERFYENGWGMNPRGKKYIHQCARCLVKAGFKSYKKYL
jgi:hypothetical protein